MSHARNTVYVVGSHALADQASRRSRDDANLVVADVRQKQVAARVQRDVIEVAGLGARGESAVTRISPGAVARDRINVVRGHGLAVVGARGLRDKTDSPVVRVGDDEVARRVKTDALDNVKKSSSNCPTDFVFLESLLPRLAGAKRRVGQAGGLGEYQNR